MLYGHYAGNNKSFPGFVQKEKMMEINKCYNENCLDTMAKMPDGFIDLTLLLSRNLLVASLGNFRANVRNAGQANVRWTPLRGAE